MHGHAHMLAHTDVHIDTRTCIASACNMKQAHVRIPLQRHKSELLCAYLSYACHVQALRKIADSIKGQSIDVVLYVDRLDLYRVDALDKGVSFAQALLALFSEAYKLSERARCT